MVLAIAPVGVQAQVFDRNSPKLPAARQPPTLVPPPAPATESASRAPLAVTLKGLLFLEGPAEPGVALPLSPTAIDTARIAQLDDPEFRAALAPFLGKKLSLAVLQDIRKTTLDWLRGHRRPFVDVSVPPQNISSGIVQVVVTQYSLGRVKVSGARYFSPDFIQRTSGLEPGQTLDLDDLQSDLDRLNQSPFLSVDAVFSPGAATGQTDVDLKASDRFPVRAYAGFDNLGVRSLGLAQYNLGVNWGNVFDTGQILSYQLTRTFNAKYLSHSVSDVIPLPWNDKLLVFGSFEIERPDVANVFHDVGHSGQASFRYVHALPRFGEFSEDLQVGYDYKTTDNNLDFAGFNVFSTQAEIDQFPLIYDATLPDALGQTSIQNIFVFSPGNLTASNDTAAIASLVPGARSDYVYNRFLATRTTSLPADLSAISRLTWQIGNHNLPDSEQLGGGGVGSVRGYFTDTALGSEGVLANQELRSPAFSPTGLLGSGEDLGDKAQFGAFFDFAHLTQLTPISDQQSNVELASAGLNAHYSFRRFADIQFDLGWRLRRTATEPQEGGYGEISVTIGN
jgi:hemolysin activation/secretion protein